MYQIVVLCYKEYLIINYNRIFLKSGDTNYWVKIKVDELWYWGTFQ